MYTADLLISCNSAIFCKPETFFVCLFVCCFISVFLCALQNGKKKVLDFFVFVVIFFGSFSFCC